ncbi:MAG: hypothetical protein GTN57_05920, partial [Acidobacteria bacterium]|nr:hypothetical protein [Acidobacteriota bacterium]NIT10624.1 hypothetical protein [Acidobacteriota bacterium]
TAEFYLSQIVSHHQLAAVEGFMAEAERRGLALPGVFGVFLYRSANKATLQRLAQFFPVPVEGVLSDFASGLSAEEICVRTILELRRLGVSRVYVSNLGFKRPEQRFRALMEMIPGV